MFERKKIYFQVTLILQSKFVWKLVCDLTFETRRSVIAKEKCPFQRRNFLGVLGTGPWSFQNDALRGLLLN